MLKTSPDGELEGLGGQMPHLDRGPEGRDSFWEGAGTPHTIHCM